MKIYVYPADITGCGYFRIIWPAERLKQMGYDIEIRSPRERSFNAVLVDGVVTNVDVPDDADVIVFQRVTHRFISESIKIIRSKGIGVVVDIDDDLSSIHPKHPAFVSLHPNKDPSRVRSRVALEHNWHNTAKACQDASVVTVSSDELLDRYARHGRGFVVNNYLPELYLDVPHQDSTVFGWGGAVVSHPDDLDIVGNSVRRLIDEGHQFKIIGPEYGVAEAIGVERDRFAATGSVEMKNWPTRLTELGVGMAPIRKSKFNEAKSWLKPLEMAGLGIPCVMSPRREYRALHDQWSIGLLANKPDQWYRYLRRLITEHTFRQEFGEASREIAASLTIAKNIGQWEEAWTYAARHP